MMKLLAKADHEMPLPHVIILVPLTFIHKTYLLLINIFLKYLFIFD